MEFLKDNRIKLIKAALGPEHQLFVVGGAVRDYLLEQESSVASSASKKASDIDLACSLPATETLSLLHSSGIRTVDIALQHSTVLAVPLANQPGIEITSLRAKTEDGRIVEGSSLEEDLSLRDFTLNSTAVCVWSGELKDPHNYKADLKNRILKASGEASQRIKEDPLRMIRAARFSATHGFTVSPCLFQAMREQASLIKKVSVERIRDELSKILVAEDPSPAFKLLLGSGLLSLILPEFARLHGVEQNCYHKDDVFVHTLEVIQRSEPELSLRLSALLHDISKPETLSIDSPEVIKNKDKSTIRHFYCHESVGAKRAKEILTRLKFDKETVSSVSNIVRHHMRPLECGKAGLRRILRDLNGDYQVWRKLKEADASSCATDPEIVAAQLTEFDQRVVELLAEPEVHKFSNLAVNGRDLLSMGFVAGRELGETLSKLHEVVIENPELNNKNSLLAKAKDILNLLENKNC